MTSIEAVQHIDTLEFDIRYCMIHNKDKSKEHDIRVYCSELKTHKDMISAGLKEKHDLAESELLNTIKQAYAVYIRRYHKLLAMDAHTIAISDIFSLPVESTDEVI